MRMLHPLGFQVFSETGNKLGEWECALGGHKPWVRAECPHNHDPLILLVAGRFVL